MDCHTSLATTRFRYSEIADLFLDERRIAEALIEPFSAEFWVPVELPANRKLTTGKVLAVVILTTI
jgi:hypothetical protein